MEDVVRTVAVTDEISMVVDGNESFLLSDVLVDQESHAPNRDIETAAHELFHLVIVLDLGKLGVD